MKRWHGSSNRWKELEGQDAFGSLKRWQPRTLRPRDETEVVQRGFVHPRPGAKAVDGRDVKMRASRPQQSVNVSDGQAARPSSYTRQPSGIRPQHLQPSVAEGPGAFGPSAQCNWVHSLSALSALARPGPMAIRCGARAGTAPAMPEPHRMRGRHGAALRGRKDGGIGQRQIARLGASTFLDMEDGKDRSWCHDLHPYQSKPVSFHRSCS